MHKLANLDARLAALTDTNCHTLARIRACQFALENIVKGKPFEGVFTQLLAIYDKIEKRSYPDGLSYEDNLLRRGCDGEFNIYAPKVSEAFHEVTKKYI